MGRGSNAPRHRDKRRGREDRTASSPPGLHGVQTGARHRSVGIRAFLLNEGWEKARGTSFLAGWLFTKAVALFHVRLGDDQPRQAELLRRRPSRARLLNAWRPGLSGKANWRLGALAGIPEDPAKEDLPYFARDALDMTVFALDQFKARTDRDGAVLVILATSGMGSPGEGRFDGCRPWPRRGAFPSSASTIT